MRITRAYLERQRREIAAVGPPPSPEPPWWMVQGAVGRMRWFDELRPEDREFYRHHL